MGSSFEDCDTWILWLTVSLGTSSSQVVPATCTGSTIDLHKLQAVGQRFGVDVWVGGVQTVTT